MLSQTVREQLEIFCYIVLYNFANTMFHMGLFSDE